MNLVFSNNLCNSYLCNNHIIDTTHDYSAVIFLLLINPSAGEANEQHVYPPLIIVDFHQFCNGVMVFCTVAVQIFAIFFVPHLFHNWINQEDVWEGARMDQSALMGFLSP